MIGKDFAKKFARDRMEAWDSHDLERILSHYSEQFEMSSPVIIQMAGGSPQEHSRARMRSETTGQRLWRLFPTSGSSVLHY